MCVENVLLASARIDLSFLVAFCLGACAAALANYCVDALGWTARRRSPWRRIIERRAAASRCRVLTLIPVAGWLFQAWIQRNSQGEASLEFSAGRESKNFWIRPFLTELFFAIFVAWRFCCARDASYSIGAAWISRIVELIFYWLLLCASLVDLDDYIIPDWITVPGTILGLFFSAAFRSATILSPTYFPLDLIGEASTTSFKAFVSSLRSATSLCDWFDARTFYEVAWTIWCFALLDRRFYWRFGVRKAFAIFFRRLRRSPLTPVITLIWSVGLGVFCLFAVKFSSAPAAPSGSPSPPDFLAYSFLGLLVGMGIIWGVRAIGGVSLGTEAMGFGDVIFLGMIGAYIGWQGTIAVFFIAPFFGLVFGAARRLFAKERQIPYGPFLALASAVYVVFRKPIFDAFAPLFNDPIFLLIVAVFGAFALFVLLILLRAAKFLFRGRRNV